MTNRFKFFRGYDDRFLGRRERTLMEAGYVWAPYVPDIVLSITRTEPTGHDSGRINMLRNRYTTTTINQNYYSTVTIGEIINLRNNE